MFIKPQELRTFNVQSMSHLFLQTKSEDLARQLTLIEFEAYRSIQVRQ